MDASYDTTLALKGGLFDAMELGDKSVEIRNNRRGIERGEIIRFTRGYNPEHGSLLRKVTKIKEKNVLDITVQELITAQVQNLPWVLDYAEESVFLFHLEELPGKSETEV